MLLKSIYMWYYCRTTYNPQIWWNKGKKTITLPWGCLWQSCCMQNSVTSSHLEIHIKTQFLFTASQLWRIDHMTRAWDETMPLQQYCPPICSPLIFMHAGLQGVRRSPADSSISECAQGWELLLKDCREEAQHRTARVWTASLTGRSRERGLRKRARRTA